MYMQEKADVHVGLPNYKSNGDADFSVQIDKGNIKISLGSKKFMLS